MKKLFASIAIVCLLGCGPINPPGPGTNPTSWVSTAEVAVSILTVSLPGAVATVQILPIDPRAKIAIVAALNAAQGALPGLSQALVTYQNSPTAGSRCAARADVKLVSDSLLAASTGLSNVGLQTPADVLVALGGLASLVDELLPSCPADAGQADGGTYVSNLRVVALRAAHLRPFPAPSSSRPHE